MQLEKIWYETSPFIYTVTGGYFLGIAHSGILTISSLILISAGGTITAMRRSYSLKARGAQAKTAQAKPSPATRARRRTA
jgi:hypothetical protein